MSFQKITIVGNIGKNFSQNNVSGKNVVNGSVAVTKNYVDKNGQKQSNTEWFSIAKWSDRDMSGLTKYLVKGTMVLVTGEVSVRSYQNKEGVTNYQLKVTADEIKLLSSSKPQETSNNNVVAPSVSSGEEIIDDLPF